MQKKIIALAIAGLASTAAFAQSNVTVYGVADVYYGHASFSGLQGQNSINSGGMAGSRLGFKGTEDLGNGLKALFTLEYALAVDDNKGIGSGNGGSTLGLAAAANTKGTNTARQQFVGVTGSFGTVVAGRLQTAGYDFSASTNVFHGTAFNPLLSVQANVSPVLNLTELGGSVLTQNSRANNAFAYISPDFNGFKAAFNHARLTENTNAASITIAAPGYGNLAAGTKIGGTGDDSYANILRGWYDNGPLHVDAIYSKVALKSILTDNSDITEWGIGAGYDFGVVNLKASYQSTKDELTNLLLAKGDAKNKAWQLSAAIPVSAAGKVLVGYAKNSVDYANDSDSTSYTVAYTHGLSKRTTLYTGIQRVTNDGKVAVTPATISGTGAQLGGSGSLFVGGINHSF